MPLTTSHEQLFKGPYYNRRRPMPTLHQKPLISKLAFIDVWVCRRKWQPGDDFRKQIMGFGETPADAYERWKLAEGRC